MKLCRKYVLVLCILLISCLFLETPFMANLETAEAAVAKASLKTSKATLLVKESTKIVINNKVSKATYTFKTSNKSVATVSKSGTIVAKKAGTADITVSQTYKKVTTLVGKMVVIVQPKLNTDKMLKNSLVSTGNNFRMKKAIEKAKNGEVVTIAYIGGSITEGAGATTTTACYAYSSYQYFKDTYGKGDGSNVKFVNAGMSGTPSLLGMIRYDRDVLAVAESAPDIVFVEFAVNDADDTTEGDAYESLVRNILNAENEPAVVLVFSVFKSRWNLQTRLQPVGEYYDLPMISISDAVVPELKSTAITDDQFFSDVYHPNNNGHKIMADCISNYFNAVNNEATAASDIIIPSVPKIGNSFEGIKMIDALTVPADVTVKAGDFSSTDTALTNFQYAPSTKIFPNNWKHSATSGKKSFIMTINCKNLLIVYKQSNNAATAGKADIYVDGKKVQTISTTGGWNNAKTNVLIDETSSEEHTIEIKMASDSTAKEFSILAFGYTK